MCKLLWAVSLIPLFILVRKHCVQHFIYATAVGEARCRPGASSCLPEDSFYGVGRTHLLLRMLRHSEEFQQSIDISLKTSYSLGFDADPLLPPVPKPFFAGSHIP